jgi:hypothetical protein
MSSTTQIGTVMVTIAVAIFSTAVGVAAVIPLDDFSGPAASVAAVTVNTPAIVDQTGLDPGHVYFGHRQIQAVFHGSFGAASGTLSGAPDHEFTFALGPTAGTASSRAMVHWGHAFDRELNFSFTPAETAMAKYIEIDVKSLTMTLAQVNVNLTAMRRASEFTAIGDLILLGDVLTDVTSPRTLRFPMRNWIHDHVDALQLSFHNTGSRVATGTITAVRLVLVPECSAFCGLVGVFLTAAGWRWRAK